MDANGYIHFEIVVEDVALATLLSMTIFQDGVTITKNVSVYKNIMLCSYRQRMWRRAVMSLYNVSLNRCLLGLGTSGFT